MDQLDQALIRLLKEDARASVTTLAGRLNVSRATVQMRMARLIENNVIRRFTVELTDAPDDAIRAVMMIELQGSMARSVLSKLRQLPQIIALHTTSGAWDLVAQIQTQTLGEFDQTLRNVRDIPGVSNSETSLLLAREY
ncbi:Lrp/AsnC family transcriptional regulator [Pseudaestuariivita rosea]|uniref:Lrp/AsnC family transcriptional regulator n=1 Tax=Pseudaestuariivita rosea TaxID=2763263 RepID=UPI001ABBD803|nr:Lrp/AsnC family transcriptional regulator [Pseudaestuariivita rosea]